MHPSIRSMGDRSDAHWPLVLAGPATFQLAAASLLGSNAAWERLTPIRRSAACRPCQRILTRLW